LIADRRRGSADLIQLVLILPIFVLLIYGSFEVWKIVSVKQSLGAATYQAARCRSVYNDCNGVTNLEDDEFNCEWVLLNEVADNGFVDQEDLIGAEIRYRDEQGNVICVVGVNQNLEIEKRSCPEDPAGDLGRNEKFDVEAELFLPWPIFIPGLFPDGSGGTSITLVARHRSYIECGPQWSPPTPTPTPTSTP
jgi:hypothetical protein